MIKRFIFFSIVFQTFHHIQVHVYKFPEQFVSESGQNLQSLGCVHRLQTFLLDIPSRQFPFLVFFSSHTILEFQTVLLCLLKEFSMPLLYCPFVSISFIPLSTRTKTKEFFTVCTWTNQSATASTTFKITQISHSPFAQFAQSIVSLTVPS